MPEETLLEKEKEKLIQSAEDYFGIDFFRKLDEQIELSEEIEPIAHEFHLFVNSKGAFYACEK